MKRLLFTSMLLAAVVPLASAQSLTTLFARNNGGDLGGAVYFDVTIGPSALVITGFDTNTAETTLFTFEVWSHPVTAQGFEGSSAGWVRLKTGNGRGAGIDLPSVVTLSSSFIMAANNTTGMALIMGSSAGHDYTNGIPNTPGTYGSGSNQSYSNADLSLALGAASNVPFTGPQFNPRVWNGTIKYDVVPEPATMTVLALGALALLRRRRKIA